MTKILYIEASPRKQRSSSIAIAHTFLDAYKAKHPADEIITVDLWARALPPFDGDTIDAKYAIMHGQAYTPGQATAWKAIEAIIAEFKAADKYVFSLPMWNFGIPYRLKHYIDIIVQPGYLFDGKTYKGLVGNKHALCIYSRGGAYGAGTGSEGNDLQRSYMETLLKFVGFTDVKAIVIEPTLAGGAEGKERAMAAATREAQQLATKW